MERVHALGGGSREQKDIFRDVFLALHRRLGRTAEAIALAQQRLLQNPNHVQSLATLAWAYGETGRASAERQACGQLVRVAEAVGLDPASPVLAAAQRVLRAA
jgi:hypothetical protein